MGLVACTVLAFVLGCLLTWLVMHARMDRLADAARAAQPSTPGAESSLGVAATPAPTPRNVPAALSTPGAPPPAPVAAARFDDEPYGTGSAYPLPDGTSPAIDYIIKANADAMTYVTPESPRYGDAQTDVWFVSDHDARKAGFTPAD